MRELALVLALELALVRVRVLVVALALGRGPELVRVLAQQPGRLRGSMFESASGPERVDWRLAQARRWPRLP